MCVNHFAHKLAVTLIFALAGALLTGCGRVDTEEESPAIRPIKMMEISSQRAAQRFEYPGRVSPMVQSELSFEVPGRINYFPVTEGQWLRKGEVIARLDDRNYRADVASVQARVNAAKADYDRFKELFSKGAVAQRELETRQRNFEVSRSNLAIAKKALEDTELRAHFAGRVARKLANDFQNVSAKESVVLLQDDTVLEIKADVPERALASYVGEVEPDILTEALSPTVSITSIIGSSFPARVKEMATAANPTTRTFEVTMSFEPGPSDRILPGMTARVTFDLQSEEALPEQGFLIPSNAAPINDQGNPFVWRVDRASMMVEPVVVKLGNINGDKVTVYEGLADGDLIAISGVHHLREGMQVSQVLENN